MIESGDFSAARVRELERRRDTLLRQLEEIHSLQVNRAREHVYPAQRRLRPEQRETLRLVRRLAST